MATELPARNLALKTIQIFIRVFLEFQRWTSVYQFFSKDQYLCSSLIRFLFIYFNDETRLEILLIFIFVGNKNCSMFIHVEKSKKYMKIYEVDSKKKKTNRFGH